MPIESDTSPPENQNEVSGSSQSPSLDTNYRAIFDLIGQGFCVIEMIYDSEERPIDYRFLEVNNAFESQTGLKNASGQRGSDIDPNIESYWIEAYGRVARTGEPQHLEQYHHASRHWYNASISRVGEASRRRVCVVFNDTTERKRHEANTAFLSEVSGELIGLGEVEKTMERLGEKIGRYFDVRQCMFTETHDFETSVAVYGWNAVDAPSIRGTYRTRDFLSDDQLAANLAGQPTIVSDTHTDPRVSAESYGALGIRSFIIMPMVREGEWRYMISVLDNKARQWRDDEVALMRDITDRIWTRLERARTEDALRESEEKYRSLFESIDEGFNTIEVIFDEQNQPIDCRILEINPAYMKMTGLARQDVVGRRLREFMPAIEDRVIERYGRVARTGEPVRFEEYVSALDSWFDVYTSRVGGQGSNIVAAVFNDITGSKLTKERQEFLLEFSDSIRSLNDPLEIQVVASRLLGEYLKATRAFYFFTEPEEDGNWIHIIETDYRRDPAMQSHVGRHSVRQFGVGLFEGAEHGKVVAIEDVSKVPELTAAEVQKYLAIDVVAFINVPLVKDGKFVAGIGAHDSSPRPWRPEEIALIQEVAARMWLALEHAQAEEALRESEENYRATVELNPQIIWTADAPGKVTFVSGRWTELTGVPVAETLGGDFTQATHPDDVSHMTTFWEGCIATGDIFDVEVRLSRVDDGYHWSRVFALPRKDESGRALQWYGTIEDIEDRKLAQAAFVQAQERLRLALDAANMGTFVWYPQEDRGEPDERMLALFGLSPGEMLPFSAFLAQAVHTADRARYADAHARAIEPAGVGWLQEDIRVLLPDGSNRWLSITARTHFDDGTPRRPVQMAGVVTDITPTKLAEQALSETRARFQSIANLVPDLLWSNDATGYTDWHNEQWLNYTGQTLEEAADYGWLKAIHPEDEESSRRNFQNAIDRGEMLRQEHRIRRADGEYLWFLVQAIPVHDEAGRIVRWFGSATDIQQQRVALEAIREGQQRLNLAIDAAQLGTCDWDYQAGLMRGNDQRFYMFGLQPEQGTITTEQFLKEIHPDDRDATWSSIASQLTEVGEYQVEYRINRPDDGVRFIMEAGRVIEWKGAEPAHVASILADVTEQREAQEILRRSNEALVLTLEQHMASEAVRTELMRRIVNTQEEERTRISRELHDNLGQHLTAVMLGLQTLETQIGALTGGKRKGKVPYLDNLRSLVDGLMRAAHDQARQLRPAELDAMGLEVALERYTHDWSQRAGVEVDFQTVEWQSRLAPEVETTLYRVAQEALTNVARHAHASFVSVELKQNSNSAILVVEDNGSGFDTEQTTNRLGMLGMKERLDTVRGILDIESIPGEGTAIIATVALAVDPD